MKIIYSISALLALSMLSFGASPTFDTMTATTVNATTTLNAPSSFTLAVGKITGLGTGVGNALVVAIGSAGAPVLFNGVLGTPLSGTLTNCTIPGSGITGTISGSSISGGTLGITAGTNLTGTGANYTAGNATKWTTGRTIALTGDVTYTSGSLDGSGNVTGAATLVNIPALSGVNLTSLNASNLGSGNVPDVRNTVANSTTTSLTGAALAISPSTTGTINKMNIGGTTPGTAAFTTVTGTSFNGVTLGQGTGAISIAAGKTLTANKTITLDGTDGTTMTFPSTNATVARTDAAQTFTGVQSMTSPDITTGITSPSTTLAVFNATPTTINAFGAATTINMGASGGTLALGLGTITFTGATSITGGAGNMTIVSGTGNSRTLTLQTTTSGGTATNAIAVDASQVVTISGNSLKVGTTTGAITDAAGVFTNGFKVALNYISPGNFYYGGNVALQADGDVKLHALNTTGGIRFRNRSDNADAPLNAVSNIVQSGKTTTYNAIATVSNGIPAEYATVDLTAQSAAKTATTIYTPAATGMFRVTVYLQITTAASTSSVLGGTTGVVLTYNDGDGNVAQSDTVALMTTAGAIGLNSSTNTTATNLNGSTIIYARTGVAIQYAIDYTSVGVTPMQYAAHLKVEAL